MNMAWLAVDYDGRESIFASHPIRSNIYDDEMSILGNPFGDLECKTKELKWLINDYPEGQEDHHMSSVIYALERIWKRLNAWRGTNQYEDYIDSLE